MKYLILNTEQALDNYLRKCVDLTVIDTETTGLKYNELILGIVLYDGTQDPAFVPTNYFFVEGMPISVIRSTCNKYFPTLKGIAHNGKYDLGILQSNGFEDFDLKYDTMIMVHTYNPDLEQNLEKRVSADFKVNKPTFKEIIGKNWDKIDWVKDVQSGAVTLEMLAEYACADGYWTYQLYLKYLPLLEKDGLSKIHDKIEIPLVYVLRDMFNTGVTTDVKKLYDMGSRVDKELQSLMDSIYEEAGCVFNINSGKQKADILFDKMRLPSIKNTKGGARATDTDVLETLANRGYQIAQYLIDYSELQKLNSGYIQSIPTMVDDDGKLRCNFNSCGTKTGRFSSNNPNLQNQPNNENFPVRSAFVARPGYVLLCFDYSQIELRVMGHAAKDKRFIEAFMNGEDIHGKVASDLNIERKHAKIVNFGVLYGMGPSKLAHSLGISEMKAKQIIEGYEKTYEGYRHWKKQTEEFAKRNGYVKNLFGRIRRLPGASSENKALFFGALRRACNTVIQGSSADIIKLAMIKLAEELKKVNGHLLLQVHDELLIEVPIERAIEAYAITKDVMENTTKLSVPLEADGKIITDWSQMKGDYPSLYEAIKNGGYKSSTNSQAGIPPWLILSM